ncbi:flavin monoamine oxidase family protein [Flavobacterium humi]|uniref:NAD(P)/FAD-dependent oxidoreductase n=1 Tax=Flavobacterium humi TaxID=2562683 RepID=A0A4Z0L6M5_9FLAO|nr:NAD(P)/FAD-dependent oxidoreductase [Flavobacterium humi]TGD57647.1 NAD(P)/FAD-dependent oxidoreductase [Flavobacterium humi]
MKNGVNYKYSRRNFVKGIGAALLMVPFLQFCTDKIATLLIRLSGTNHILGHKLRIGDFPKPTRKIHIPYLIVGGGISGLSAARQLVKKGKTDFLMIEMEGHLGGNSSNGENQYSKFPLGAHYLPLPNFQDKELLQFLKEEAIILGYDANGFPVFDELQLTFAPEERLFYKNNWQEGLVPKTGNTTNDDLQFERFFSEMDVFRRAKGEDGKFLFDIPLSRSSSDGKTRDLDLITMKKWLQGKDFSSQPLFEYIDYCCRDDFGLGIEYVSAWAGMYYFCARKQDAAPDKKDNVLTWPEGNARLASHLKKYTKGKTLTNHLVYEVKIQDGTAIVKAFDAVHKDSVEITADTLIMATPQFVNQYVIGNRKTFTKEFQYAPWLLATLTVPGLSDNSSFPLCWDNVIHGSAGLGYIYDQHQSVKQVQEKKVITYYRCFPSADLRKTRRDFYSRKEEYWKQLVFEDLKTAHPDIETITEQMDIHLLGHGMISAVPGFIFGEAKKKAAQPIGNTIFFAHSDLSGISVFEEAFHQGINVVNQILDGPALDT